ncbi:MAG: hypothetical protein IPM54_14850 [Polyangiaceae bacterium]|nr:hypothetical protein [Polyangiaceae bacterium]
MARASRPPGFDMSYRPEATVSFGPPLKERLPWFAYFVFALGIVGLIVYGQNAPTNSTLFRYVVEEDRHRLVPASVCAIILFCSALAGMLRDQMRGVVIRPEGVELRELLSFGIPRVRRWTWAQIDRMRLPTADGTNTDNPILRGDITLDLWDGSSYLLPTVNNPLGLALVLERVALARSIPIEGGTGMLDDLSNVSRRNAAAG